MLKLFFRKPMHGTYVEDGKAKEWEVRTIECPALGEGQSPPPEGLVTNFQKSLVDEAGNQIESATLRQYDLAEGLATTMRRAWAFA
jgi:hypothetical protein